MKQLQSIKILRAVAATTVIVHHVMIADGTAFGEFRVDIFFVLSGFVIALVLDTKPGTIRDFLASRLTRIVPLYWIATLLVFFGTVLRPDLFNSTTDSVGELLKSLFFIPYRKESGQLYPMLFVGWTLNYEMFFYLISALALLFVRRYRFIFIAVALCVILLLSSLAQSSVAIVEFLAYDRLLEFPLGIAVWVMWRRGVRLPLAIAAPGVVAMYVFMTVAETAFPGFSPLSRNGLPALFMLMCTLNLEGVVGNSAISRALIFIGDASYATYLSHPFVVESLRKLLPHVVHGFDVRSPLGVFVAIITATTVGCLVYRFVDRPLSSAARRVIRTRPRVVMPAASESLPEG